MHCYKHDFEQGTMHLENIPLSHYVPPEEEEEDNRTFIDGAVLTPAQRIFKPVTKQKSNTVNDNIVIMSTHKEETEINKKTTRHLHRKKKQ